MDNSRICHCRCFMSMVSKNFVQPFLQSRKLLRYTHAWTKLHNEVMSWILGAYEYHYSWPLPEANSTTVHDLTAPSVSSLPLPVIVRSRFIRSSSELHMCKFEHPFVQFKFSVYGHKQASKQTYTPAQCSHASVGLAQACPNYHKSAFSLH